MVEMGLELNGGNWFECRKLMKMVWNGLIWEKWLDDGSSAYYFLFILKTVKLFLLFKWLICLTNGKQIIKNYNQSDGEYTCQSRDLIKWLKYKPIKQVNANTQKENSSL